MPPNVGTIVVSEPFEGNECHQTCWNLTLHDLTTAVEQGGLGMSEQEAVGLYEKAINDVCAGLFELELPRACYRGRTLSLCLEVPIRRYL
jgi:hypothetical protein